MVAIKKKLAKASPKKDATLAEVFKPKLNVDPAQDNRCRVPGILIALNEVSGVRSLA
jgi:hypothetical protein